MAFTDPKLRLHTGIVHPQSYPVIRHVDDIAPHVADNKGIRLFKNGPIMVLRYLINDPSVFQTAYDLECRGLVFDSATGRILSRPFHKFFNFTGPDMAEALMEGGPLTLYDKLDGSMIGAFLLDGEIRLHTKGGFSEQALAAQSQLAPNERALILEAWDAGATPIFEWVGPDNRIVLAYDTPRFVLLGMRHRESGAYDEDLADALATKHGVDRPDVLARVGDVQELMAWNTQVGAMTGIEGVVGVGPDGRRIKIKTRAYLSVHKALTMLSNERHAFRAVVEEIDDDLLPLLPPAQAAFFQDYATRLRARVLEIGAGIDNQAKALAHLAGAERAAQVRAQFGAEVQPLVFAAIGGKPAADALLALMAKRTGSQTNVAATKEAYGLPDWAPPAGLFMQD